MKYVSGLTIAAFAFAAALVCFMPLANAHGGAADQINYNYRNFPDAHATVTNTKDTTVVHKKSPSHFKVCADHASAGPVAVTHDDATTEVDPGNCANVEASKISAKATADGHHRITVWEQQHSERMMDRPSHK